MATITMLNDKHQAAHLCSLVLILITVSFLRYRIGSGFVKSSMDI